MSEIYECRGCHELFCRNCEGNPKHINFCCDCEPPPETTIIRDGEESKHISRRDMFDIAAGNYDKHETAKEEN